MREVVLDTETTGLKPEEGHRIVEIGAVEMVNRVPTGRYFHEYINPKRDVPVEAFNVHGLSAEFLADKPVFETIADPFLEFIGDATLVIHNAAFDMAFLNAELLACGKPQLPDSQTVDTLMISRKLHRTGQHSLDALCKRYNIDNTRRQKHGALLDSELLAEVYIELNGGRQASLVLQAEEETGANRTIVQKPQRQRPNLLASRLNAAEIKAHREFISELGDKALWLAPRNAK